MWGTITIGGVALREETEADQDGQVVSIAGQESYPPQSRASVLAVHDNLTAMAGLVVPVVFSDKAELSGFYRVSSARSRLLNHGNGHALAATWAAVLERLGGPRDLEVESTIPRIPRQTALVVTPSYWHAPAAGALDYFTGSTVPSAVVLRDGREGIVPVFTGLPAGTSPRWTVAAEDYMTGAARLTINGRARIGALTPPEVDDWTVENGLVRLTPGPTGRIVVECWNAAGDEWASPRTLAIFASAELTTTPELTVLRNEPEEVIVRLQYPQSSGRVTVDLGLRRGSRFVTGIIKRHAAATLGILRSSAPDAATVTGGVRQTAADASGNRDVLGSPSGSLVYPPEGNGGYIIKHASTRFDFFAGHEVSGAVAGDQYAALLAQYLGSTGSADRVVKRG